MFNMATIGGGGSRGVITYCMKCAHLHTHTLKHKETLSLTLLIQQWCDAVLLGFDSCFFFMK